MKILLLSAGQKRLPPNFGPQPSPSATHKCHDQMQGEKSISPPICDSVGPIWTLFSDMLLI